MKKLLAHGDRVIVQVVKDPEISAGGVVIPENVRERSQRGRVIAVGPGRFEMGALVPMMFEEGDVVLFSKYGGTELPEGGDRVLVLREADVLAIETDEEMDAEMMDPMSGGEEEIDHEATFPERMLTVEFLEQLAAIGNARSDNPPMIVCGSERVRTVARAIVADTQEQGPLFGLFDTRVPDDPFEEDLDEDQWRVEAPAQ